MKKDQIIKIGKSKNFGFWKYKIE